MRFDKGLNMGRSVKIEKLRFGLKLVFVLLTLMVFSGCVHNPGSVDLGRESNGGSAGEAQVEGRFVKGERAPGIVASGFEGERLDISEVYGDKAVVLDFWAGWCSFCVEEMPELDEAQDKFSDEVKIIGVHRTDTESEEVGMRFARELDVSYQLVKDERGKIYSASGGIGMPVAVFVDQEGVVREIRSGPKTKEDIEREIKKLF